MPHQVSALGGFAPAQHLLGNAYATGQGLPVDLKLAAAWLERAVAGGSLQRAVAVGSMPSEALGGTQRHSEVLAEHAFTPRAFTSGGSARADREEVPRTALIAAPIGSARHGADGSTPVLSAVVSADGSTPVLSAVVSADGSTHVLSAVVSADGSTPVLSAVVSADGSGGPSGGPSVGSRAAYDLARLLLRGVENGWPSPLPESAQDPCVRAAELLTAAAADGHVRARAELAKGSCELGTTHSSSS